MRSGHIHLYYFVSFILIQKITCNEAEIPGNRTDFSRCKVTHMGVDYLGIIAKTEGNVRCQSWATKTPVHQVHASYTDSKFPEFSKEKAKNNCRNPSRDPNGPWCYTMDPELIDDNCGVPLCSLDVCRITGPGMEYAGAHHTAFSAQNCLKWDKKRKKVRFQGNITVVEKFDKRKFPDESLGAAKKHCRNPDGDLGGPWCFVEIPDSSEVIKEYCDIPFCDDPDCMMFSRNHSFYGHYLSFPQKMTNFSFGVKLWDPDSYLEARATLLLTLLSLPLSGKEIDQAGIGIEISLSNTKTALTVGNKDEPEYETTHGIIKSTEYTFFTLQWDRGFITLNKEGEFKPIFLQEVKIKNNLLGFSKQNYRFYSAQGNNIMWSFPFCDDEDECDVHTSTSNVPINFWPLFETDIGHELKFHVRATSSAQLFLAPSPVHDYPNVRILIHQPDGYTRITTTRYKKGPTITLVETKFSEIISYWQFSEFSINIFSGTLSVYWNKDVGNFMIMEAKHDTIKSLRWFSPLSDNNIAHWTFNCKPPKFALAKPAFLPECALDKTESFYIGSQRITAEGSPCLPWSANNNKWFPGEIRKLDQKLLLEMSNFCRDPLSLKNGTYCYTLLPNVQKIEEKYCKIRKCKSAECRMAGTGNDFIGKVNVTRSNRTCQFWVAGIPEEFRSHYDVRDKNIFKRNSTNETIEMDGVNLLPKAGPIIKNVSESVDAYIKETDQEVAKATLVKVHNVEVTLLNGTLYADMAPDRAENFCRNPSRSIAGAWCYTLDPKVILEACHVPDCNKNEECIIILLGNGEGRKLFILPQWREGGHHGGIRFSLKQWNPDYVEGVCFEITSRYGNLNLTLNIGAEKNQKVNLYKNGKQILQKTMPYIIPAGKWVSFWLQIRQGEIQLGFEGVRETLVEWIAEDPAVEQNPTFLSFQSIGGHPVGMFVTCDECHCENTTTTHFSKVMPINIFTTNEQIVFHNLTLQIRGDGHIKIRLMNVPGSLISHLLELHDSGAKITLTKRVKKLETIVASTEIKQPILWHNQWITMNISFSEEVMRLSFNDTEVFVYKTKIPMIFYYFSIAVGAGSWVTWLANCDPLDIDGPPRDGGWSVWSTWQCSVTCGGGDGYRTRRCSNPRPNIFGQLCHGDHTSTGKCNEFECGDLSPETFDLIRHGLQTTHTSLIIKENHSATITTDMNLLAAINIESPEATYIWTLNGQRLITEVGRVDYMGDDIVIRKVWHNDSGIYTCILFRINNQKVIIRVVSLAVIVNRNTITTRATLPITLNCKSLTLGYVYSELIQKWLVNNTIYIDYGVTTLAAVSTEYIEKTNRSQTGTWTCVIEEPDLGLKWTTNIEVVNIKRAPNLFTHLKEDALTKPIFGKLPNDASIVVVIICFILLVFGIVGFLLYAYLKWGRLPTKSRRKKKRNKKKRNRRL